MAALPLSERADGPVAWVLNLDADVELAVGAGYARSNAVRAAMRAAVEKLAAMLLVPGDVLVTEESAGNAAGLRGRAFCPTPRAVAWLERAGASPEAHPAFAVLRAVNSRAFCASLGQTLPGAVFARSLDEALATLAAAPPIGRQWRAKRAFGMAGRGQRGMAPGASREISAADRAFLRASIDKEGGIQLEPEVAITRELALHGLLSRAGELVVGRTTEQRCDAHGQWLASVAIEPIAALDREVRTVAAALFEAGYFGPFGVDAFEHEAGFQPRSEINARYAMGFPASGLRVA